MTLPSEGINPWRGAPAHSGPQTLPANYTPANLPDVKIDRGEALNGSEKTADGKEFKPFGDDGATFWDLIDVVNPLQHIPVVSTLYRELTDDTLDPAPRVMGSTLFMGPIGLVASVANVMVEHNTGKDLGGHVMAYFKDDAAPLSTKTAAAAPAAAGTDGSRGLDPVSQWAAEQNAFYRQGDTGADPVTRWASEQQAFYQGRDARPAPAQVAATAETADPVSAWAQSQHAYYQDGAQMTQVAEATVQPAAAGTDGMDVTAWAQAQTAFYQSGGAPQTQGQVAAAGTDGQDVTAWAAQQTAFYRGEDAPASATDPVSAWAQRQTAYYRAGAETMRPAARPRTAEVQTAAAERPEPAGTTDDVSAWARDQMAWVMGDRAKELAALPAMPAAAPSDTRDDRDDVAPQAPGAVAEGGGWFRDNMVEGWARYQAAQQLAEPGYRADLNLATAGR
jgi:hypothetical protein